MRVYVDSSALLKRVFAETETPHLQSVLGAHHDQRDALLGSSLAWVEVTRAIHLATALLLDVDLVLTYDTRLATACSEHNIAVAAPSAP